MRTQDFALDPDGPTRFIWALTQSHPNAPVTCGNMRDSAAHLARLYTELLQHAQEMEDERDKWRDIATKLASNA